MKKHTGLTSYQHKRLMKYLEKILEVEVIYINWFYKHGNKILTDAQMFGIGFMKDGEHVSAGDVFR